jgi:hypothetical protein
LADDAEEMLEYLGKDFVLPQKSKSPVLFKDSTGDNASISVATYGML